MKHPLSEKHKQVTFSAYFFSKEYHAVSFLTMQILAPIFSLRGACEKWHNSEVLIAIEPDYKRDTMKNHFVLLLTGMMLVSGGASAAGCVKGAAAGAVVGHVAGHHAVAGAVGGCLVGRHMAKEKAKKEKAEADAKKAQQAPQAQQNPQQAPAK